MIKHLKYFFQSIFIYLFFLVAKVIGLNLSRKIFSYIFLKFASKFRSREIIEKNLKIYSKEISQKKIENISSSMWRNYGMTFIEYIFLNSFQKNNSNISIKNEKLLENIISKKKPVIFVSGHFANYELMSMQIVKKKVKLATIYKPLNNYFVNPLMEYLRKKYVCGNQIKKGIGGVKEALQYLDKGHSLAMMIDQRVSEGEKINFFNKPALTTTLPAQLSLKLGLSIVPVYIERLENNFFNIEFLNEIKPTDYKDKIELTEKLNQILESMIIKNPYQWIWTHNRWK